MIEDAGLENVVRSDGVMLSTHEALKLHARIKPCFFFLPLSQPYQIPAKTYEYMAAGCPILALTESQEQHPH